MSTEGINEPSSGEGFALDLVVAMSRTGCIGGAGGLLWHLREDLLHFKALTRGHVVIMGRATFDSIGKALPERVNIVITSRVLDVPGVICVPSFEQAIRTAEGSAPQRPAYVIGGARVYAAALPWVRRLYVTWVDDPHLSRIDECDTFFPTWEPERFEAWQLKQAQTPGVRFMVYQRREFAMG